MTVMKEDGSRADTEGERIESTETDELEVMRSGSQSVTAQESTVGDLLTPIPSVVQHRLMLGL